MRHIGFSRIGRQVWWETKGFSAYMDQQTESVKRLGGIMAGMVGNLYPVGRPTGEC